MPTMLFTESSPYPSWNLNRLVAVADCGSQRWLLQHLLFPLLLCHETLLLPQQEAKAIFLEYGQALSALTNWIGRCVTASRKSVVRWGAWLLSSDHHVVRSPSSVEKSFVGICWWPGWAHSQNQLPALWGSDLEHPAQPSCRVTAMWANI